MSENIGENIALSALDKAFFVLASKTRMSNIGPIAILKPPRCSGGAKRLADKLMRDMKRLPVGALFNRVYRASSLKGLRSLQTVAEVDLDTHCHRITLEGLASDDQLFDSVCRVHEERLGRKRPPWAFHIFDGLADGRVALYAKGHHGLIDGRGFVEVCTRWFTAAVSDKSVRAIWEGTREQRRAAPRKSAGLNAAALADKAMGATCSMVSLHGALARLTLASAKLSGGMPLPLLGMSGTLRGKPSVRRSFGYCVLPLSAMKSLGKPRGTSVNDVLLAVLDMALTRYLADKGRPQTARPLVAGMPVALGDGAGAGGNSIAILQFPLGTVGATPLGRLAQIGERTVDVNRHAKRTGSSALVTYTAAVHDIPALLEVLGVKRPPLLANMLISNPFGLAERRYLAGAELEMALPLSVLAPGQSLNISAVTYDQCLQSAFMGIEAELPVAQVLADLTQVAIVELLAAGQQANQRNACRVPVAKGTLPLGSH